MNNEIDLSVEKRVLQIEKIINENIIGYEVEYFSYPTVLESRKEELLPLHITLWKAEKPVLIIGVIEYETIKRCCFYAIPENRSCLPRVWNQLYCNKTQPK